MTEPIRPPSEAAKEAAARLFATKYCGRPHAMKFAKPEDFIPPVATIIDEAIKEALEPERQRGKNLLEASIAQKHHDLKMMGDPVIRAGDCWCSGVDGHPSSCLLAQSAIAAFEAGNDS